MSVVRRSLVVLLLGALLAPAASVAEVRHRPTLSVSEVRALFGAHRYADAFAAASALHEWGETALHYELGYMLDHGLGTPVDRPRALSHYLAAARNGHVEAMHAVAEIYELGEVVPRNDTQRCDWLERAAARGHPDSIRDLAHCYGSGRGRPGDDAEMLRLLHSAAARGHLSALHDLLHHYRLPERRTPSPSTPYDDAVRAALHDDKAHARTLAQQAIAAGDYRGYGPLGATFDNGEAAELMLGLGRLFDSRMAHYATAQMHIARGAVHTGCTLHLDMFERGFLASGVAAGRCYLRGDLTADDAHARACALFEHARSQGNAAAHVELARCRFESGESTAAEALAIYAAGAERDASVADPDLEGRLCGQVPQKRVARRPGREWAGPAPLERGDRACLTGQNADVVTAYVPRLRWLGPIALEWLTDVPPRMAGLTLEGLTREQVRRAANDELRPIRITPEDDRFWLDPSHDRALRFIYGPTGRVVAAQLIESFVFDRARFLEQASAISADAGASDSWDPDHPLMPRAHWSTAHWDTELVLDISRAELRRRVERR